MTGFFQELQRRKVYRVAAAYIIAAGFIIQIGSAVFPAWELPNWAFRLVVVLLLIGFPIALILAWAYDVTPQGIRATSTPSAPIARSRRNIIMLIAIGVIISAGAGFFLLPRASARKVDKSIAVLPFQNLSDEKENAYFADGIQDDILTNLSKIGDLKVISRMSVMSYRGDGVRNAREIGKALGVGTLLEGSVRRAGNRVRVSVQLINANNDEHIWAEDYDRDLTDVFAIQTDLAQKIAASLQAKLSPNEKERIDRRPTQNSDAYLLYVQAHDYANRPDHSRETALNAERLYQQAIKLDPDFAAAYAGLSQVESWAYHSFDPVPARRENARLTAEKSLQLNPDLAEGHLALGFSYYYGARNYTRALAEFEIAKGGLPNQADAYMAIGAIQRRQGKWRESTANFEKAAELDPKNASILFNLGANYLAQRDFAAADRIFDQGIAASPQSYACRAFKGLVAILSKGDVNIAEKQLALMQKDTDVDGGITSYQIWLLFLQRKFSDALQVLQEFRGEVMNAYEGAIPKSFFEGVCYSSLGDKSKAHAAFEQARVVSERLVQESPDDAPRRAMLGQILAALGQKDAAITEAKRIAELLPESEDAFGGPAITLARADIYTWTGEHDQAFDLLGHLLEVPNGTTVPLLKLDPVWDPLRNDPRFQALIDKYAARR
jgi:TolB-like protein/Flp pilus assembly protein TadD